MPDTPHVQLRPNAAQTKPTGLCAPHCRFCRRRRSAACSRSGAQRQQTCARGVSDEAHSSVCPTHRRLSFVRMRPRPSLAKVCARRIAASAEGVGAQLARDLARSGSKTCARGVSDEANFSVCLTPHAQPRPNAAQTKPRQGLCTLRCRFCRRRRSAACSQSGAQRQPNLRTRCV